MLKAKQGLYGLYITRDGQHFDELIFINRESGEVIGGSGIVYNISSIDWDEVTICERRTTIKCYGLDQYQ